MKELVQKRYHIIHFTTALPYVACTRYQCIPRTWIKDYYEWMSMNQAIAVIYYPAQPVKNMWLLKNMKKHDESWKEFIVDIVYSSDNYEDAKTYLKRARRADQSKKVSNGVPGNTRTGTDVASPRGAQRSCSDDNTPTPALERTSPKLILKLPNQPPRKVIKLEPTMKKGNQINQDMKKQLVNEIITKTAKVLINRVDVGTVPVKTESGDTSSDDNDVIMKKLDSIEVIFKDAKNSLYKMKTDFDEQSKLSRKILKYLKDIEK